MNLGGSNETLSLLLFTESGSSNFALGLPYYAIKVVDPGYVVLEIPAGIWLTL